MMSVSHFLRTELGSDGILTVTFDAPGEPVNTLRREFAEEFAALFDRVDEDLSLVAVVLCSAKPDNFIAGADINMLAQATDEEVAAEMSRMGQKAVRRIAEARVPVVAAIHGACLGGGLEIALACHGRVASGSEHTKLGLPEVQLGILPGMGGTVRLPQVVGLAAALDLLLTGKQLSSERARRVGLVDEVVPAHIVAQVARERARLLAKARAESSSAWSSLKELLEPGQLRELALADNPLGRKVVFDNAMKQLQKKTQGNYPAPEQILRVVRTGLEKGAAAGFAAESKAFGELVVSEQARALRHVYFSGQALKKSEYFQDYDGPKCTHLGVVGAGLMGAGVTYVSADHAGCQVRLKDISPEGLQKGLQSIDRIFQERVKKKRLSERKRQQLLARITRTVDGSGFSHLDLVIEAVFEDLDIKRRVLADVENNSKKQTIFASNTSSLPIASIAEQARFPERVIGMHYFSPVDKMPLLEIITTEKTADWVIRACVDLGKRQKKTIIVVGDGPGFYTTRILGPYLNEAAFCLLEGASVEDIDEELVRAGFPIGPLALLDEIGIDVGTKVAETLMKALGPRLAPPDRLARLLQDGRLGKKNKKGIYDYQSKASGKRLADESVYSALGLSVPSRNAAPSGLSEPGSVAERCLLVMVNEATHCLADGVLKSPRDGDIGAIYGLGFPPYLGGPFHFVDAHSATEIVARLERLERTVGPRFAPSARLRQLAESGERFFSR